MALIGPCSRPCLPCIGSLTVSVSHVGHTGAKCERMNLAGAAAMNASAAADACYAKTAAHPWNFRCMKRITNAKKATAKAVMVKGYRHATAKAF